MPILVMMLLIGLFAGVWGFRMCFLPARWDRLTEAMSFAGRWIEPSPKRLHPLLRFGNRIGGLAILAVGCWFAYMAASEIYLVLTGRATTHTLPPTSGPLPNTPAPGITALSIFVVVAGILMAGAVWLSLLGVLGGGLLLPIAIAMLRGPYSLFLVICGFLWSVLIFAIFSAKVVRRAS